MSLLPWLAPPETGLKGRWEGKWRHQLHFPLDDGTRDTSARGVWCRCESVPSRRPPFTALKLRRQPGLGARAVGRPFLPPAKQAQESSRGVSDPPLERAWRSHARSRGSLTPRLRTWFYTSKRLVMASAAHPATSPAWSRPIAEPSTPNRGGRALLFRGWKESVMPLINHLPAARISSGKSRAWERENSETFHAHAQFLGNASLVLFRRWRAKAASRRAGIPRWLAPPGLAGWSGARPMIGRTGGERGLAGAFAHSHDTVGRVDHHLRVTPDAIGVAILDTRSSKTGSD